MFLFFEDAAVLAAVPGAARAAGAGRALSGRGGRAMLAGR